MSGENILRISETQTGEALTKSLEPVIPKLCSKSSEEKCPFMQSADQGGSESVVPSEGNMFAQLGLLGRSNKAVPQALTRRVLELLAYLAKHHVRTSREMLTLKVPSPEEQAQLIDAKPVCHHPMSNHDAAQKLVL